MGFVTFLRCASGNYSSALVARVGDFPPRVCIRPHFAGGTLDRRAAQTGAVFESERGYCSRADAFSLARSNRAPVAKARRKANSGFPTNPGAGSAKSRCHPTPRGDAAAPARSHAARDTAPPPRGHSAAHAHARAASCVHAAARSHAKIQTDTASQGGGDH